MLANKGSELRKRAKPILTKFTTNSEGGYCAKWNDLSLMVDCVYRVAPWFLHFEESWGAVWVLKKLLNQRVSDGKRSSSAKKPRVISRRGQRANQQANPDPWRTAEDVDMDPEIDTDTDTDAEGMDTDAEVEG
ncbi:hypothetical protein V8E54_004661 [Elaphomyces granulatus]